MSAEMAAEVSPNDSKGIVIPPFDNTLPRSPTSAFVAAGNDGSKRSRSWSSVQFLIALLIAGILGAAIAAAVLARQAQSTSSDTKNAVVGGGCSGAGIAASDDFKQLLLAIQALNATAISTRSMDAITARMSDLNTSVTSLSQQVAVLHNHLHTAVSTLTEQVQNASASTQRELSAMHVQVNTLTEQANAQQETLSQWVVAYFQQQSGAAQPEAASTRSDLAALQREVGALNTAVTALTQQANAQQETLSQWVISYFQQQMSALQPAAPSANSDLVTMQRALNDLNTAVTALTQQANAQQETLSQWVISYFQQQMNALQPNATSAHLDIVELQRDLSDLNTAVSALTQQANAQQEVLSQWVIAFFQQQMSGVHANATSVITDTAETQRELSAINAAVTALTQQANSQQETLSQWVVSFFKQQALEQPQNVTQLLAAYV